jgi:hypothetical protein
MISKCLLVLGASVLMSGCIDPHNPTGPLQYESPSFDHEDLKELRLDVNLGAGDLKIGSGTRKLMQAYFAFNVPSWKPEVRFDKSGDTGTLTVRQPGGKHTHFGGMKYEWDLRLAQDIPVDVRVNCGAGEATLDLGSLMLRGVEVDMGVGSLKMDLRGNPKHDYNVHINGGVGEATVHLPGNVGVYAEAGGGIGEISAQGLTKDGGHWINEAYEKSPVKIHVSVQGGVGSIKLIGD